MLHIKRQQQSAFHFENSPQQSIDAFPNLFHTTTGTRVSNSAQNLVSSTSTRIQPSISSSSVLSSTTVPIQSTSSSPSPLSSSSPSSSSVVATVNNSGSKLSTGAIAGIAVGGTSILLALLAIATLLFLRRRNTEKNRLSIENTKEKKPATIQNEKPYSETSSPTPLVKNQYIVNDDDDEDVFWNAHPIGTFRVFSTYTQTLDDELYIQPGDKVQIYTEYDDGWCLGINLTRGGSRGVFPQHCINIERPL